MQNIDVAKRHITMCTAITDAHVHPLTQPTAN